jgi:uncharacterized membrane protein
LQQHRPSAGTRQSRDAAFLAAMPSQRRENVYAFRRPMTRSASMTRLVGGLILFFTLHFVTATPALRGRLVALAGDNAWRGVMTLGSLGGIALIASGWSAAPNDALFASNPLAIRWAPVLVGVGLVLFLIGGFGFKAHLRHWLRHPMLVGASLWSGTHLLANGGLRETLLFGAFFAFSLYALCTLLLAGKRARFVPEWKWDAIGLAIGLFVAVGVMHGHQWLFGVAVG